MVDTTIYPYSSIVLIYDKIGSSYYEGSGVLISPDEVLTASHLVWSTGIGTATNITVYPGYNSGTPLGSYAGVVEHYNPINDTGGLLSLSDSQNDYALIHLASPTNAGYMQLGADYGGGTATVGGYPGYSGLQSDVTETISKVNGLSLLSGTPLGAGSSGGPVFVGNTVYGLVSSGSITTGYFNQITAAERAQINAWVQADDAVPTVAGYIDNVTGKQGTVPLGVANGGPSYLQWQYIWSSADGVALSSSTPNVFLHGGAGQDSIQVTSGQNVLDGGTGSNFMTGGTGIDTFFTDARGSAVVWNTLRNFHAGDAATLWGFTAGVSSYSWDAAPAGAAGYTGATLRANIVGGNGRLGNGIDASITFAGLSVAQAKGLTVSTGTAAAGSYLYLTNPGV